MPPPPRRKSPDPRTRPPDPLLIEAALCHRLWICDLTDPERLFVVDHLTRAGHTAEQIATWLHCSLRLIRKTRSRLRAAA